MELGIVEARRGIVMALVVALSSLALPSAAPALTGSA
jgi:hypothetical protein